MHTPSVAVLGGGVAGLAAATKLAEAGLHVTLVEPAITVGGAAASIVDPRTGFEVDLAPPVFSAHPDGAAAWLARMGAGDRLLEQDLNAIELLLPGHSARLAARAPAGALRAAATFWGLDLLGPVDRARAAAGALMVRLEKPAPQETHSLYRWLRQAHQSPAAISQVWNPLAIVASGLAVEEVAADVALPALAASLGAGRAGFRVAFARQGLAKLFDPLTPERIRARSGVVLTGQAARRLVITGDRVHAVELTNNQLLKPDAVVLALPPAALHQILPDSWSSQGPFALIAKAHFQPRASVHLFYDRAIMAPPVAVALADEPLWLVQRVRTGAAAVSVYPAAGPAWASLERDEAIARADQAVRAATPESPGAKLVHALHCVQPSAVLLAGPGSAIYRPGPETPLTNAWLAGAWTRTGLPGSMDGAYISGRVAAEKVLKNLSIHGQTSGGISGDLSTRGNPAGPGRVVSGSTVDRRPSATTSDGDRWGGL